MSTRRYKIGSTAWSDGGYTHHNDTRQTKLPAHQSSFARHFLLQRDFGGGCCDSKDDADLTEASLQVSCLIDQRREADANGRP